MKKFGWKFKREI